MSRSPLLVFVLASACGTTVSYTTLQSPPHPIASRSPASVELCQSEPTRPYVTVGIVETQPDSEYGETRLTPKLVAEMRRTAARAGCDALIMQGSSPAPVATLGGRAVSAVSYRGSCVVFTAPTASR